ncbi:MAG: hypothetical protein KDI88_14710 [Gammaproteobacteria bacterium]|nr:hypothetical protein [Gammaproteobacteria bacterium]
MMLSGSVDAAELFARIYESSGNPPYAAAAEDNETDALAETYYDPYPGLVVIQPPYSYGVGGAKAKPASSSGALPVTLTLGGEIRASVLNGDYTEWNAESGSQWNEVTVAGGSQLLLPRLLLDADYIFTQRAANERGSQNLRATLQVGVWDGPTPTSMFLGAETLRIEKTISSTNGSTVNRWVVRNATTILYRGDLGDVDPIDYDGSAFDRGKFTLVDSPVPEEGVVLPDGSLSGNTYQLAWTVPPITLPGPGTYYVDVSLTLEVRAGSSSGDDDAQTALEQIARDGLTFDTETPLEAPPGYLLNSPDLNIVNNTFPLPPPPVATFDFLVPLLPLLLE